MIAPKIRFANSYHLFIIIDGIIIDGIIIDGIMCRLPHFIF